MIIYRESPRLSRDVWRWKSDGVVYLRTDGEIHDDGAPKLEQVICNATLLEVSDESIAGCPDRLRSR